jgi:hypothetical protein
MSEETEVDREKLIDRVKKLLALAGNNSNENEAAVATAKASRLIAEYNLTLSELKDAGDERIQNEYPSNGLKNSWERTIWFGVAELNFCMYYYSSKPPYSLVHHLIGTEVNVISSKVMADYLVSTVNRLAQEAPIAGTKRNAFRLGCADRLYHRLAALKADRAKGEAQTTVGTTLPALADLYGIHNQANLDLYSATHNGRKLGPGSRNSTKNHDVYAQGYVAGGGISLDTQVGKTSNKSIR